MAEYALELTDDEHRRYRAQAEAAGDDDLWELAGVVAGARVADLGCGPGEVILRLAERVGPHGCLVGVDADPEAVARARHEIDARGPGTVTVARGTATDSGLAAGTFDVVLLRHVLIHNGGREQAIVEHAASLLRPGGCVVAHEADMTMVRTSPPTAPMDELYARYDAFQQARGNDTGAGLHLGDRLTDAGLELLEFRGTCRILRRCSGARGPAWAARAAMVAAGAVTPAEVEHWAEQFDRLDARPDQPRIVLVGFDAVGRRVTRRQEDAE